MGTSLGWGVVDPAQRHHSQRQRITTPGLQDLRYPAYDGVGNLLRREDGQAGSPQTQSFAYDDLDRLTNAAATGGTAGDYAESYGYDALGNLTAKNGVAYQYLDPAHAHAVTHLGGSLNYTYDASGNMLTRSEAGGSYNQVWDAENRLASVTVGGQTTTFTYDGDGRRVKKQDASGTTIYVGQYYEVIGSAIRKYYHVGGARIAVRQDGARHYLFSDHLGSTSVAYDTASTVTERQLYLPYGAPRWPNPSTLPTDYRFTGQRSEEANLGSLYDYNARFYSPTLGRFLNPDSIVPQPGDPQSLNRYAYTLNNPLRWVDPSGHVQACADGDYGGGCGSGMPWWENERARNRPFSIRNIDPGGAYGQGEVPLGDHVVSIYLPPTVRTFQNSEGLLPLYEPKYGLPTPLSYVPAHDIEDYWWGDEVHGKNAVSVNQWTRVTTQRRVEGPNLQDLVEGAGRGLSMIPESPPLAPHAPRGEVGANALVVAGNVGNGLAGSGWESSFVLQVSPTTGQYRVVILSRPGYTTEQFYSTYQGLHAITWGPQTIGRGH